MIEGHPLQLTTPFGSSRQTQRDIVVRWHQCWGAKLAGRSKSASLRCHEMRRAVRAVPIWVDSAHSVAAVTVFKLFSMIVVSGR